MSSAFRPLAHLCLLSGAALGAELTFSSTLHASAGTHQLTIGHVPFGNGYGFTTRGFNGGIPGPTLRMKPGETLSLTLTNNLLAADNKACTTTNTEYCETATANFHTHGLHVSSKGMSDGLSYYSDDIFAAIGPGSSADFRFTIPDYHMGGTHWYHPHHHHATAIQAGGGAAGVLIVEDPDNYLPSAYAAMIEKVLFVSGHNLNTLQTLATRSQSSLMRTAATDATSNNLDTNVFVVNGQLGPTMTMPSHTWHRFRMVYAAVEQTLQLTISAVSGGASCNTKLLAKDGIYLDTMPRDITTIYLYPGTANVNLMELSITETSGGSLPSLPTVSLPRPCYLANLRSATVPSGNAGNLNLNGGGRVVQWNGAGTSMTYANTHAGGNSMATWPALTTFATGQVYEMVVQGANAHPLHIHVNPYQVTAMGGQDSYGGGYFQVGDWHDTLMLQEAGGGGSLTVRMQTDAFGGKMVVHCHILEHEDEGMMAWIDVGGTEGAVYPQQSTLDSTCFASAFSGNNTDLGTGPTPAPTPAPPPSPSVTSGTVGTTWAPLVQMLFAGLAISFCA